jgi:hypothetical protein
MLSENNPEARELAEAGARYDVARSMDRGGDAAFMAASLVQAAALLSIARSLAEIAEKTPGKMTWSNDPENVASYYGPAHPPAIKPGKKRPSAAELVIAEQDRLAADRAAEMADALAAEDFAAFADPDPEPEPTKKSKKGKKGKKSKTVASPKRQLTTKEKLADALAAAEAEPGFSRTPPPPLVARPGERDPMIEVDTPGLGRD